GLNRLGFLDGYDTIFAHLVHSASDHLADLRITGGHGSNLRDFRRRVHRGRTLLQLFYCLFCSSRDTAVELNWVSSRSYVAQAFKNQSLCQQSSGRGAITALSLVLVATDFTSCAPRFSKGSSTSISRAMVTPSLVTVGPPKDFDSTTLRPRGPSVTFTASARVSTPRWMPSRAS